MKILTGTLRGREIKFRPNPHLRPTSDRARKAIFDMLQGQLEGKRALDLFSGTGALGFEALSNGAGEVVFVEENTGQAGRIESAALALGLNERVTILTLSVKVALQRLSQKPRKFDFVFLDPPYQTGLGQETLKSLDESSLLTKGAMVVFESGVRESHRLELPCLKRLKEKIYGDARLEIYQALSNH